MDCDSEFNAKRVQFLRPLKHFTEVVGRIVHSREQYRFSGFVKSAHLTFSGVSSFARRSQITSATPLSVTNKIPYQVFSSITLVVV
jgi:hypothetical protein